MARNIPSLYSLSENALYNAGVIPANLRQNYYPEQLVERYEEFANKRAATETQKIARAKALGKAKIVNILNRIESRRQAAGLPRLYGENKLINYNLTTREGTSITKELVKLDIQDFMYQSFWWKLVRHGIQFFTPAFFTARRLRVDEGARRATNGARLLNIINRFVRNIEQYINAGIIHPRDLGARQIRRMRGVFLTQVANAPSLTGGVAGGADYMWNVGFGQLGRILFGPERRRAMFGGAVMSKEAPIPWRCSAEQLRLYGKSLPPDIVDLIKKNCYASIIQDKAKQLRKKKLKYVSTLLRSGAERISFAVINDLVEAYNVLDDDSKTITEEMFRYLTKKDYMNKSLWWKIVLRGLEQIQAIHDRAKREFNPRDHDPGTEPWITVLDYPNEEEPYFRRNQALLVEIFNRYIRLNPQPRIIYKPGIDSDPDENLLYMTPHTWEGPFVESWRNFDKLAREPRRDESWYDQTERLGVERRVLRPGIRFSYGKKSKR